MYTCSADKTINVWDLVEGKRIKKYKDHEGVVNSVQSAKRGESIFCSSSDDMTVRLFDERAKQAVDTTKLNYQPTSATFSDTNEYIFYGGLDNQVKAWNIKSADINEFNLLGHTDTITGKLSTILTLFRHKSKSQWQISIDQLHGQNCQNVGYQSICCRRVPVPKDLLWRNTQL